MAWPATTGSATTTTTTTTTIITTTITITANGAYNDTLADNDDEEGAGAPGPLVSLTVPVLMFCTGLLGNLVALVLLWRSRRENARSVFYRLVAGLAVTDLLGTLATSPVTIIVYSNNRQWVGGQPLCDYFSFMMIWAGLATVVVVGCMALERYLAILHPYFYERRVRPGRVKYVLAAVWLGASLFSCLPLAHVGRNVRQFPGTWCFFDFYSDRAVDRIFSFVYASIGLAVIASTFVCNVAVMAVLLRMRRVSKNIGKSSEGRTLVNMTSEMQMIFFLAGIILVFATCYSPLMVRVMINASKTVPVSEGSDLMAIRLASLNQILDPWVYLLFRRRLANLLYSACKSVSPLQNMSSFKAFRSEFGHSSLRNSPRNSPALPRNFSAPAAGGRAGGDGGGEGKDVALTELSPLAVANGHCVSGGCGDGGGEEGVVGVGLDRELVTFVAADVPVVMNGSCRNNQDRGDSEEESHHHHPPPAAVLSLLNEDGQPGDARISPDPAAPASAAGLKLKGERSEDDQERRRSSSGSRVPAHSGGSGGDGGGTPGSDGGDDDDVDVDEVHPESPVVRSGCDDRNLQLRSLEILPVETRNGTSNDANVCEVYPPTGNYHTSPSSQCGKSEVSTTPHSVQSAFENSTHDRGYSDNDFERGNVESSRVPSSSNGVNVRYSSGEPQTSRLDQSPREGTDPDTQALGDRDTNSVKVDSKSRTNHVGLARVSADLASDQELDSDFNGVADTAELVPRDSDACAGNTESAVQSDVGSLSVLKDSSSNSSSVVCRHGNLAVVKGSNSAGGKGCATNNGESLPLLDAQTVAPPCGQCERDSQDAAFV